MLTEMDKELIFSTCKHLWYILVYYRWKLPFFMLPISDSFEKISTIIISFCTINSVWKSTKHFYDYHDNIVYISQYRIIIIL